MTAREPTPKVVYVLGPGRSGTGVLGRVLSTIEGTVFAGDQRLIALPAAIRDLFGDERLAQRRDESQRNGAPVVESGFRLCGRHARQPATL